MMEAPELEMVPQLSGERPVAVITGAGRGIGRALVDVLLESGYIVIPVVRSLAHVAELFSLAPQQVMPIRCDVAEPSTEVALGEFLSRQVSRVDLLINNAGFGASGYGVEGLDYQELENVLAVHCLGPIRCVRACLPFLRVSTDATIVNVSSRFASLEWVSTGVVPSGEATYPYRMAKAALNMFTSCLSVELSAEKIRVFSIDPGKVKTRFGPKDADTEPQEAARAVMALLASSDAKSGLFLSASGEKLPW